MRFSLGESCSSYATQVAIVLKAHPEMGQFATYFPSAFEKDSCDPNFTDFDWPCRGTCTTCVMREALRTGKPSIASCWRYSFRWHQQLCKDSRGFMLQIEEFSRDVSTDTGRRKTANELQYVLGAGQKIETAMAQELNLKIFRIRQGACWNDNANCVDKRPFTALDADKVATAVLNWYSNGAQEQDEENIKLEDGDLYNPGLERRFDPRLQRDVTYDELSQEYRAMDLPVGPAYWDLLSDAS